MKTVQICLLLGVVVFATGCPKYKPSVDFKDTRNLAFRVNEHFQKKQQEYHSALGNADPETARRRRNELIEDTLPYIDSAYEDFITDLTAGRDRINFVADVIELGTSAAIGITNGERPIQILGVALTAFRGGRRSADLNFYRDQSTPLLITKMDGNRARVRATILIREKEGVDTYPIGAAIGDIVSYYNAGTLVRAFTELQKDTAVQTREDEENLEVLKGVRTARASTQAQRDAAVDVLPILESLTEDLNSTDAATKAAATTKLKNIVAALEKDPEVLAVLKVADIASTETDGAKLLRGLKTVMRKIPTDSPLRDKLNSAIAAAGR